MSGGRGFTRFVGVSLGGGRGKTTAVARLELASRPSGPEGAAHASGPEGAVSESVDEVRLVEARVRHGHRGSGEDSDAAGDPLFRDEVLVAYLERHVDEATAVAINAPLTLPPCIRCTLPCPGVAACPVPVVGWMRRHAPGLSGRRGRTDPGKPAVTPYTQRAADLLLAHAGLQPRESLGQGMGPLAARAAYLRRVLSPRLRLHENLIEVHPPATLIRLAGEGVVRRLGVGPADEAWELRRRVLGELRPRLQFDYVWPDIVVRSPHVFEAVIAAYTAFLWSSRAWQGPDDVRPAVSEATVVRDPLDAALDELGGLWLTDGWIWVPPVQTRGGAASSP